MKTVLFTESPSSCGRPCVNDAHVVNLGQVSDVQVKREATSSPPPHPVQNVERVLVLTYYIFFSAFHLLFSLVEKEGTDGGGKKAAHDISPSEWCFS